MKNLRMAAMMLLSLQACKSMDMATSQTSIVGGQRTSSFPAIGEILDTRDGASCTATLISPRLVLTAAHCLEGRTPAHLVWKSDRTYPAVDMKIHPLYKAPEKGAFHDIGLVMLKEAPRLEPIALELGDVGAYSGREVVNIGFGVTDPDSGVGAGSKRQSMSRLTEVRPTTLRTESASSTLCDGDSGGPLLAIQGNTVKILGVASYVDLKCAHYSIYTRVDAHRRFLLNQTDDFPCGSLTEMGLCEGKVLSRCVEGKVEQQNCATHQKSCDWDDQVGTYGCME